jgi:XTP/dITP diphosphohydrolase
MMKFVLASKNQKKIAELQTILGELLPDVTVLSLSDIGITEDIVEDGMTFEENALIKARTVAAAGYIGVGDDSGLCVDALGGDPGIHSARWAGEHGNDAANNDKMLAEMAEVPDDERTARFHSTVVLITRDEDGEEILAGNGDCEGTIARDLRGTNGFGYDPLFELADIPGKRMAELEPEEKNAISHRRRALDDLVEKLS